MLISEAPKFVQNVADSLPYDIVEVTQYDNHYSLKTESGYVAEVVLFFYIVKDGTNYHTFSRMEDAINYLEDDFQFCLGDEVRECPRLPDDAVEKEEYDRNYYAWEEACWLRGEVVYK